MTNKRTFERLELTKNERVSQLNEVLKNDSNLKEVHIDIYSDNPIISSPFMLLIRSIETNVTVSYDDDRLILTKSDLYKTHYMNLLLGKVKECYYQSIDNYSEFVLNIQNIWYRITVFN